LTGTIPSLELGNYLLGKGNKTCTSYKRVEGRTRAFGRMGYGRNLVKKLSTLRDAGSKGNRQKASEGKKKIKGNKNSAITARWTSW